MVLIKDVMFGELTCTRLQASVGLTANEMKEFYVPICCDPCMEFTKNKKKKITEQTRNSHDHRKK